MRVVVTGGGGYVGYHVGWALSQGGHQVTLLDLAPPDPEWQVTAPQALWDALPNGFWGSEKPEPGHLEYEHGSVTCEDDLIRLFQGATAVIHTASYGLSGQEQLSPHVGRQEEVNVGGSRAVIAAALTAKVRVLVYTSTYNVVFGGQEVPGGDQSSSIFPLHAHTDHYSRTKAIAEMLVLMANGKSLESEEPASCHPSWSVLPLPALHPSPSPGTSYVPPAGTLRTCALRLSGVMGLGERRHSRRVISALRSGLLVFTFGRRDGLVDFAGIQNVVQAHVRALMALLQEQGCYVWPAPREALHSQQHPPSATVHPQLELPVVLYDQLLPTAASDQQSEEQSVTDDLQSEEQSVTDDLQSEEQSVTDDLQSGEQSVTDDLQSGEHSVTDDLHSGQQSVTDDLQSRDQSVKDDLQSGEQCFPDSLLLEREYALKNSKPKSPSVVSGNAFFISDGCPINHFEYFRPWFDGLGYDFPTLNLPLLLVLVFAHLQETIYRVIYKFFPFTPLVTPAEAYKSGVTHFFSCRKAEMCFGYRATRPNDHQQVVRYLKAQGHTTDSKSTSPATISIRLTAALLFLSGLLYFLLL